MESACKTYNDSKPCRPRPRPWPGTEESPISPPLLAFLAVSFLFHLYNLGGRAWAMVFVAATYSNLLLLFLCVETHHMMPLGSRRRRGLRAAVWLLSSTLLATISYRVAGMMPLAVKVLVWAMAGATISGFAFGFFIYRPKPDDNNDGDDGTRTAALEP